MQWLFAFIGLLIAAIADENILIGGFFGFLIGHVIGVKLHIKRLESQLNHLQLQLKSLKKRQQPLASATSKEQQPALETIKPPPIKPIEEKIEVNKKPVAQDPWFSENKAQKTENRQQNKIKIKEPPVDVVFTKPKPNAIDKLFQFVWNWFTDGNTFVRIGIVILFIGVSFLLNFAIDKGFIAIELRLAAVIAFAIFLLSIGWKLRQQRSNYALLIQGGAVGLLYLTIFASFSLYHVLPSFIAFGFLVIIVVLSASLAVLQNALPLALFGVIGGFLAPILTSSGANNFMGLFSFYALLNAGIFAIAWFKAWKILNLVGFSFTFSISSFWGANNYQPENFASIEPFLILFFLFYVGIAILYAIRREPDFKDYVDGTLIFGTPIIAFGMQAAVVHRYEYGIAISAFVMGAFYLILASWCWKKLAENLRFLSETLLAVAVIFATLAIPFAVGGASTSAAWAVESTGVLWVSIRQAQHFRRVFALILQLFAGFALLSEDIPLESSAFLNSLFVGVLIISVCAALSSWLLYQPFEDRRDYEAKLSPWLLVYSLLCLFGGYEYQIESHTNLKNYYSHLMISLTLSVNALLTWVYRHLSWTTAYKCGLWMLVPLLLLIFFSDFYQSSDSETLLSLLAMIIYFWTLKQTANTNPASHLNLHLLATFLVYFLFIRIGVWELLLFASVLSLLFYQLYQYYQWEQIRVSALLLLPLMWFLAFICSLTNTAHPFKLSDLSLGFELGYLLWTFAFVVLYRLYYCCDHDEAKIKPPILFHVFTLLLLVLLPTWEVSWHLSHYLPILNGWHIALYPLTAIIALWLIMQAQIFPFKQHPDIYIKFAAPILILYLLAWTLISLHSVADSDPLPWLPFVNPAELMQIIVFITLIRFIFMLSNDDLSTESKRIAYIVISCFIFIWLNVVLARSIHHWGALSWSSSLWEAPVTQTSLSIFWTLTGLSFAIVATRKQIRKLWIVGASLLVVVIIKLLLFDMSSHNSIERIVSFITVGILLMLIGYFAPLPPIEDKEAV